MILLGVRPNQSTKMYTQPVSETGYYNSFLGKYLSDDPELLTSFGISGSDELGSIAGLLTESTDAFVLGRVDMARNCLREIESFPNVVGDKEANISKSVLTWYLECIAEGDSFCWHSYPVHSRAGISDLFLSGVSQQIPLFMIYGHPLFTRQDSLDYISRLYGIGRKISQLCRSMKSRVQRGLPTPRFVLSSAIDAMEAFTAPLPSDNLLVRHYEQKLPYIPDLDRSAGVSMLQMIAVAVEECVYPAYRELIALCRRILHKAPESSSLCHRKGGEAYYQYLLKKHLTLFRSPDKLHADGVMEIRRLNDEIRMLLGKQSATTRNKYLLQRANNKSQNDGTANAKTDTPSIQEETETCINNMQGYLETLFGKRVSYPVKVEPMIDYMESFSSSGYYEQPSCLTEGYGVFYCNMRYLENNRGLLKTLTAHETVPGHHFQTVYLYDRIPELPSFRRVLPFTSYNEGWAVYAEKILGEAGFYDGDVIGNLGRLESELRYAARMVIDTGIHGLGWSREEAADNLSLLLGKVNWLDEEIDRACIQPAAGCAYTVGGMELLSLRERLKNDIGKRFSLSQFHHEVLNSGPCPLDLLGTMVSNAIRSRQEIS